MTEPLTLTLGAAIAKAVFKGWFKDNEFLGSLSESVVDLISKHIPDWKARSAAGRQFDRIAERAAESLDALIKYEWRDLPHGEQKTAVHQVKKALQELDVTSAKLAALLYDTTLLTSSILDKLDASMLCLPGRDLATRLASESAQLIIDISSTLPEFHRDSYAEILKKEVQIIEAIDQLFEHLSSIRQQVNLNADAGAVEFEANYRRAAVRKLDRIELFGLNASTNPSSRQHSLSTAYISLSVSGAEIASDDATLASENTPSSRKAKFRSTNIRAEEAASVAPRIVIKGEAGSGKTTLLQSLAVRCAAGTFDDDLIEWNSLVPFFIPLRALSGASLPQPEDFPRQIASVIAGTMPVGWVHDQLQRGRGLILVDGLDEISENRRELTRRWIEEIIDTYPESRIVLSSRPPAIPDGWLHSKGFTELELLPMSPSDVSAFIEHWHTAVSAEEQDPEVSKKTRDLSPQLRERIRADRSLRELASSPLLCAMLCAMNRDRREVLPSNRIALYDAATQMILHGRDEQRQIKIEDLPELDFETKRDLLQEVALWMMENSLSMADEDSIVELVSRKLPRFSRVSKNITSSLVVKSLIHRSGVLRSPVDGKCDFIHNAFKEFLCARAVSENDKFGFLLNSISSSEAWREVAPMAAAITDDRRRTAFLSELLKKGDAASSKRAMYHLLAVRCLDTCTQLNPETHSQIKARLTNLKAPRTITEAKSLSAAGDLATDLARRRLSHPARTAASCVRTLRLIGSSKALDVLEHYGVDGRATVAKELMAAWPFFDRREYARRVLSQSRSLWGGLSLDSLPQLEGVAELKNLKKLSVSAPRSFLEDWHYQELENLENLLDLSISSAGKLDLARLTNLTMLSSVYIDSTEIIGVDAVNNWDNLVNLTLNADSVVIARPTTVQNCISLVLNGLVFKPEGTLEVGEDLHTFFSNSVYDNLETGFLKVAKNLKRIALPWDAMQSSFNNIPHPDRITGMFSYSSSTFSSVSDLPISKNADAIWLMNAAALTTLDGLERFEHLEDFKITGAKMLRSIEGISNCKKLRNLSIDFSDQQEPNCDLSPLAAIDNLMTISAPIAIVRKLRALGVSANFRPSR